ncbi:hypothetical protein CMV_021756 [Castanea mollissima]|uniref:Uncharacterized protein n=1 Tax=Castanea mollissima TaxID=60419 RepID=A0A8J4QJ92_9ROSI|nr:hypothetical protein CMV_021756 [Castanea mollissima]
MKGSSVLSHSRALEAEAENLGKSNPSDSADSETDTTRAGAAHYPQESLEMENDCVWKGVSPAAPLTSSENKVIVIPDEIIAQIWAASTKAPGWFEKELGYAWKHIFPISLASIRSGKLPLDHNTWSLVPNSWWKFYTDILEISWEAAEELSRQRRPSVMPPHWDKSEWIIQERKLVDFRGLATAH